MLGCPTTAALVAGKDSLGDRMAGGRRVNQQLAFSRIHCAQALRTQAHIKSTQHTCYTGVRRAPTGNQACGSRHVDYSSQTAEQPCPPGASVLEMTPPPPVDPTTVPLAVVSVLSYTTPATLLLGGQPPPEVSAPSHNHVSICSPSASIFVSGTKAGDEFIRRKLLKDLIHFVQ